MKPFKLVPFLLGERWHHAIAHRRDAGYDALKVLGCDLVGLGLAGGDPSCSGQVQCGTRHASACADDEFNGGWYDDVALKTDGALRCGYSSGLRRE